MIDHVRARGRFAAGALLAASALLAGCGGGGGSAPKSPESANLYVKSFSHPNYTALFLDEEVMFLLSAPVLEDSINHDSIQIRTGTTGGTAPFGEFVRGVFMVDPVTLNRVVVDPDQLTENVIHKAERTGNLSVIRQDRRIDLGYDEPRDSNGNRLPLFDRSRRNIVTFVPEIPTRAALDDTGYAGGASYTVAVPGFPATDTLENLSHDPLLNPNNRVFTSSFAVVPSNSYYLFLGSESTGVPRVIYTKPYNADELVDVGATIHVYFNQPLDPRTVTAANVSVQVLDTLTRTVNVAAASVNVDPTNSFTAPSHGFANGTKLKITTTGTPPAPFATGVDYYVVNTATNSFQLAATTGGVPITITSQGAGTHTFTAITPLNIPVPISVFLAQQRLGRVELTLTPIIPLTGNRNIRVTLGSGITDLRTVPLSPTTFSFFTGDSNVVPQPDYDEEFDETPGANPNIDPTTTANWNQDRPYLGGVADELTAAYAPYAGDGTDGSFVMNPGDVQTIDTGALGSQRVYNFSIFSIASGAILNVIGSNPLVIHCQGDVDISGTVNLPGGNGGDGINGPDTGGTAPAGGLGGPGGPGGSAGGDGAFATLAIGSFDGKNGSGPGAGNGGSSGQDDNFPGDMACANASISTANDTLPLSWYMPANLPVQVSVSAGGTLPTGLSANTTYYVVGVDTTAMTFKLSGSSGGAAVDLTATGTGTTTITPAIYLPPNTAPAIRWPRNKADGTPQDATREPTDGKPKSYAACRNREGGGGGSYGTAGTNADNAHYSALSRDGATVPNGGDAGATWGDAALTTVYSTTLSAVVKDPGSGGTRTVTYTGIPSLGPASGGSGGGGGGGEDDDQGNNTTSGIATWGSALGSCDVSDDGGAGGGGGGGAFQIITYANVNVAGTINCKGGKGGNSYTDATKAALGFGAGGGGGSGGVIWLQCRGTMTLQAGLNLDVSGGAGGQGFAQGTNVPFTAGAGGAGLIRLEDGDGTIANAPAGSSTGTFSPPLNLDSFAISLWYDTGMFNPDYQPPTIDATEYPAQLFNGTIAVYFEGANEDITTIPDDQDLANTTGWVKVFDTTGGGMIFGNPEDMLDGRKYVRFKVEFHVDPNHTFVDPLPTVRRILIDFLQP